jgi:hypothetical protein
MNQKRRLTPLMIAAIVLLWPVIASAAVVTFQLEAPTPGPYDVSNLVGAARDADNVGTATADGAGNDGTTYVAHDRGAQGQTFLTLSGGTFQVTGVWLRHCGYTANTDQTWYAFPIGGRFGIRITDPAASGTATFVLGNETYTLTRTESNIPVASANTANGTGTWIHLVLDTPVRVTANKLYGFDVVSVVGSTANMFFETLGIKDDAVGGNPYAAGSAYSSGSAGAVDNVLTSAPGDRVFVVEMMSPTIASAPSPADKATDISRDISLSWTAGEGITSHDVYFGADYSAVSTATRSNPLGVLVSQGQSGTTFDPGLLPFGQICYWRVDEIGQDGTVYKGAVWTFTVEPLAYQIEGLTVAASGATSASAGAINTINNSGMTGDLHGTDTKTMWLASSTAAQPAWIRYDFDRVYKLQELWVWNHNTSFESMLGFGAQNTTIEYSSDGASWTKLGDFEFAQASGEDNYAHNTTVSFGGVAAKSVRITIASAWTNTKQSGLSEVRFFYIPVTAGQPNPATGATGIDPTGLVLGWRCGREAASHSVYIGTDSNAVKAGTTATGTSATSSYTPAGIQLGATYYWRVDEVNAAADPAAWAGDVWSFTTREFLAVDDFESYGDASPARIFDVWVDGWGTTTNGSQVGYSTAPFAEKAIIHGDTQSMPLAYNNSGSVTLSEATRTFDSTRDWTVAGIKTLVVYFHGVSTNSSGQLYVKINGTKVDFSGSTSSLAIPLWKQWNIDLTSLSGLKAVKSLTIGVSGSGSGILYVDDIRLYKSAPAVAQPSNPGTNGLMAYFPFESDAKDASGYGYTGTLTSITFVDSMTGFGKAAVFNGTTGYIDLGASFGSGLIKNLTNGTAAAWVNYTGTGNVWQRVFDFGSSTTAYMFLATRNANSYPRFAIIGTGTTEVSATDSRVMSVGWHHLAGVVDASKMTIALYVDGMLAQGDVSTTVLPKDLGATTQNWVGRSMWTADPYLNGSVDDLRIYNRVLSAGEISYLAGDR